MLIRLHRALSPEDQTRCEELFAPYIQKTSGQYIYGLSKDDLDGQLAAIGAVYHQVHTMLAATYQDVEVFRIFSRVYADHFAIVEERVVVRPGAEMGTDTVQSPDDLDATYRFKSGRSYQGQAVNVVETAHPDNPLQLIIDVTVAKNNRDDSDILHERIDAIKEKTPDLDEMHHDGGFGSEENDTKFAHHGVTVIQTGIKGFAAKGVPIEITEVSPDWYTVSCPSQTVQASPSWTRWKADFLQEGCAGCAMSEECQLKKTKAGRVYYFNRAEYLKKKRLKNIETIDKERRTLRANVEATVAEFKRKMHNGKLKVRGRFRTTVFAFSMAVSINFGRIYRHRYRKKRPRRKVSSVYAAA
jgi:hypothetical protein